MLKQLLESSRFLIAIAVVACLVGAVTLLVYGAITVGKIVVDTIQEPKFSQHRAKLLSVEMIEMVDVFLIAAVLYIVALGLFGLFVDATLDMPPWLNIITVDELKTKMVGIIIVLIGVSFLDNAVTWGFGVDIIYFGAAIGFVILALALSTYVTHVCEHSNSEDENVVTPK